VLSWQCLYGNGVQGVGSERAAIQQGQAKGLSRDGDQLEVNRSIDRQATLAQSGRTKGSAPPTKTRSMGVVSGPESWLTVPMATRMLPNESTSPVIAEAQ
jgi:hypothetical protein